MPGHLFRSRGHRQRRFRDNPTDVAHIGRSRDWVLSRIFQRGRLALQSLGFHAHGTLYLFGEFLFFRRVGKGAKQFEVLLQGGGAGAVHPQFVDSSIQPDRMLNICDQSCALGDSLYTLQNAIRSFLLGVSHPEPDARVIGTLGTSPVL
jgi:hypothetical protein